MQTQHACPRCHAPIQVGDPACRQCGLALNPAALAAWQAAQVAPPPPPAGMETKIREYGDPGAYSREAARMARDGWQVQSVIERTQNPGWARCCTLGLFAMVLKPKPHMIVTYTRPRPARR